jgi:hypothetical protein
MLQNIIFMAACQSGLIIFVSGHFGLAMMVTSVPDCLPDLVTSMPYAFSGLDGLYF